MFWLNAVALPNIVDIFVTLLVFHEVIFGLLNTSAVKNIYDRLVTDEGSVFGTLVNVVQEPNAPSKLVTLLPKPQLAVFVVVTLVK
jgi:hypothetical protein